jgi:hypothetical protein
MLKELIKKSEKSVFRFPLDFGQVCDFLWGRKPYYERLLNKILWLSMEF